MTEKEKPLATGKHLKQYRKLSGKSITAAADHFGVSRTWWSRCEGDYEEIGKTLARAVLCEIEALKIL